MNSNESIVLKVYGNTDKMKSPRFVQMRCIYRGDKPDA